MAQVIKTEQKQQLESKQQIEVKILLPLEYNNKKPIESEKFDHTRKELIDRFGGCSVLGHTAGYWIDSGIEYKDTNTGFAVVVDHDKSTLRFLAKYKETLKERFQQLEIFMTYTVINRI